MNFETYEKWLKKNTFTVNHLETFIKNYINLKGVFLRKKDGFKNKLMNGSTNHQNFRVPLRNEG